ncbi:MAG: ATP-binding protein [Spirochaetales bacterium]|nr:ATP-binding protein [Spirochaetales bacterium]
MLKRLFFKLLPIQVLIIAMGSINSIVDGAIAGRFIDAASVGVVGLHYTFVNVIDAVGAILLGGSSILCGKYMGRGELEKTNGLFSLNLSISFIVGSVLTAVSLLIPRPLARMLGASPDLESALVSYIRGYGFGIVPLIMSKQIAMFLQLERKSRIGYAGVAAMILSNIVLDVVFVSLLDMGTFGIAFATSIGNWLYLLIMLPYYFTRKAQLSFSFSSIDFSQTWPLLKTGFPGAALIFYLAMRSLCLNIILLKYAGNDGLSAQGAFGMVCGLIVALCLGIGAVVRMMSSVLEGEGDREGIRAVMRTALTKAMLMCLVLAVLLVLLSGPIASVFFSDRDSNVYALTRQLFIIYSMCLPFILLIQVFNNYLQALGHHLIVNILSFLDGFLSMVGPSLLLAPSLGALGVWLSHPIGMFLILVVILVYACIYNRHFPSSFDDWLFLRPDFGVSEDDQLEISALCKDDAISASIRVQSFCERHLLPPRICYYAALSTEEMVMNVINHGFSADSRSHQVIVRAVFSDEGLLLRIKDDCIPFDPKERYVQLAEDLYGKNIGIRMVMRLTDDITYQNLLGLNVLTIRFRSESPSLLV